MKEEERYKVRSEGDSKGGEKNKRGREGCLSSMVVQN